MHIHLLCGCALLVLDSGAAFAQAAPPSDISAPQVSGSAASSTGSPPAAAQPSKASEPSSTPQTSGPAGLGEIIVTAQRRSESLQRAAVAVDVVGGKDLVSAGITQPDRLGELVPALQVQASGAGNLFFIRGVGNFSVAGYSDPAIAFNYDGVYVARPAASSATFYDLDRIEVLKGPQGTLYGRNATGGAINVIPTQPKLGSFSGFGNLEVGNYADKAFQGAVNVPVGDKSAFRFSGAVSVHDGYRRDGSDDDDTGAFRGQFKTELSDRLTIRLATDIAHIDGVGPGESYVENSAYNPITRQFVATPAPLDLREGLTTDAANAYRQTISAGSAGRNLAPIAAPYYPDQFRKFRFYGANAEIDYDLGFAKLTIIPAWRKASIDTLTSGTANPSLVDEKNREYSIETRLTGSLFGNFLDYQAGFLYYNENDVSHLAVNQQSQLIFQNFTIHTQSYAGFGRLTAHVTDRLRLVGGVRYTSDHRQFNGDSDALAVVCIVRVAGVPTCPNAPLFDLTKTLAGQPIVPSNGGVLPTVARNAAGVPTFTGAFIARQGFNLASSLVDSKATFRAAVEYDVNPTSLAYASVETGYRSGGFNLAVGYPDFKPETITAYTIGLKNRFLQNRLQLNAEGFYWRYKNEQAAHVGADLAGNTVNFTQNVGRSNIYGGELEGRFLLTPTTVLSTDIQYLHSEQKNFTYLLPFSAVPPRVGCRLTPTSGNTAYMVDCSGRPNFNSPRWTVNLGGEQTVNFDDYKLVLGADAQYRTRSYTGFEYLASELQKAHWLANAQVTFGPKTDRWSVAGFVRNIQNKQFLTATVTGNNGQYVAGYVNEPRVYGMRLGAKF